MRCSSDFPKDVMDVPELQCGVRARETQVHDGRLQNAEAQVVARRGVCWIVLAQFCWQRGVLQGRRDRKSQESRGHGHRPRSFVEVLKAEASKFVPAMAAVSTTIHVSSAEWTLQPRGGDQA